MTSHWSEEPDFKKWADHVTNDVVPKMTDSAYCVSLVPSPDSIDVKFCVELGMMIMMDKPIIAVVAPGSTPSAKLVQVADLIVEGSPSDPSFEKRLMEALSELDERYKLRG